MKTATQKKGRRQIWRGRKRVQVNFACDEDLARALLMIAHDHILKRSQVIKHILRRHVIESPAAFYCSSFPPEQDLELWVWANIERRDQMHSTGCPVPPIDPRERLVVSKDGENVIRLDFATAA